jgi:L-asparaginase II
LANPILVHVTRGDLIESIHRGAIAIADASGALTHVLGNVERPVYPRSSLKPIQALPLVESGAADAFGLSEEEIALACASHSGEPMHTTRVAAWLKRIGCSETDLACGPHPVRYEPVWRDMVCSGEQPTRIHNNCSGKHTGFLTLARHLGAPIAGYEGHDHPVQVAVARSLADLAGVDEAMPWGVDGCAAPNFALPLSGFARALAKLANPRGLTQTRADAARRIVKAMAAHPELVSGSGRACAVLMRAGKGRVAVKTGAEGVFAAIIPEAGLGIALKIDDGATRASETVIAALLEKLGLLHGDADALALARAPVTNTRDATVGERRPAAALAELQIQTLR